LEDKPKLEIIEGSGDKENRRERREDDRKKITRGEFKEIIQKILDCITESNNYVMEDINTLFQRFVYPTLMELGVLTEILKSKGLITDDELKAKIAELKAKQLQNAKPIDEEGNVKEEDFPEATDDKVKN